MATITKKGLIDDIQILLTKFSMTDEGRIDEDYLSYKIDQIRAQLIVAKFDKELEVDPTWLQDIGIVTFNKTNFPDDATLTSCQCAISKAFIPQVVSLSAGNGSQDIGLYGVLSSCGKTRYYPYELAKWSYLPSEHTRNKFHYYSRVNTALYVNKVVSGLRLMAVLQNPEDGFISNSTPIASGSIVTSTVYIVKFGQVIYNGATYQNGDTFTGTAATTFFTSNGLVYLNSAKTAFEDTDAYPVSGDMARQIVIEICTKEFQIEKQAIVDLQNDSRDDAQKQ
jgi:hypothetical protein